jgi:hypothetical protein
MAPRIFYNPMPASSVAFAQVRVFIPERRLVWKHAGGRSPPTPVGGVPGEFPSLPPSQDGKEPPKPPSPPDINPPGGDWAVGRQDGIVRSWDLLNQHWTAKLVPAAIRTLPAILQEPPNVPGFNPQRFRLPDLAGLQMDQIGVINTH